jgi:hypothetical protein
MRTESEVQDRIRYLLSQELDRRVAEACARLPHNCGHNHKQPLDVRQKIEGRDNPNYNRLDREKLPVIGLCMLGAENPSEWKGTICEDPIDAQRCPYFDATHTKETVQKDFDEQIRDLGWVSENMPEVAGLLWALGSESMPSLPWWKRLWFRFVSVRPDPIALPPAPLEPPNQGSRGY